MTPGLERVRDAARPRAEGVAVVPVRETEAWLLTVGNALRAVPSFQKLELDLQAALRRLHILD